MNHQQVLVAVLLCCLGLLLVPAAGSTGDWNTATSVDGGPTNADGDVSNDTAVDRPVDGFSDAPNVIDAGLVDVSGPTKLLVFFDAERAGTSVSGAGIESLEAEASATQEPLRELASRSDAVTVDGEFWLANVATVTVDTDRVPVEALARLNGVVAVRPTFEVRSLGAVSTSPTVPGDVPTLQPASGDVSTVTPATTAMPSGSDTTWGLAEIRATEVWDEFDTRGANTSVAIIDTGVDPGHDDIDITPERWAEFDENGNEVEGSEPQEFDPDSHGTHVSGTVAGGNASGTHIGVAPDTDLYHGAALTDNCENNSCTGTFEQIIGAMEWAVEQEVNVLSMSLGANDYVDDFIEPVQNAHDEGTTVVAAIGNDGVNNSSSPGNVYDAISVGASDENQNIAGFSSGELIDTDDAWGGVISSPPDHWPEEYVVPSVSAPGTAIKSAERNDTYGEKWGTSMATPHVAGTIALMQSVTDEHLTASAIEEILEATATKPDDAAEPAGERDIRYGSGIIDAYAATEAAVGPTASFTVDPEQPEVGENTTFDASPSTGDIETYNWTFSEGEQNDTGEIVTRSFEEPGNVTVTLMVTDTEGQTANESRVVQVVTPPGPTAAFSVTPSSPQPNEETLFDASDSTGDIETYEWDFTGDGVLNETGENVTYTYSELDTGPAEVTLRVTDEWDQTDSVTRPLYVGLEALEGFDHPPQDVTGDGLYRDLTADGNLTMADVQALFDNLHEDEIQHHVEAFDFTGLESVNIFDVQALFNTIRASES